MADNNNDTKKYFDSIAEKFNNLVREEIVLPDDLSTDNFAGYIQRIPDPFASEKKENQKPILTPEPDKTVNTGKTVNTANTAKMRINARTFFQAASADGLGGSDLLKLLGNSRLDKNSYSMIVYGENLTAEKLIEILDNSDLNEHDYEKLILAAHTLGVYNRTHIEKSPSARFAPVAAAEEDEWYSHIPDIAPPKTMKVVENGTGSVFVSMDKDTSDDSSAGKNKGKKNSEKIADDNIQKSVFPETVRGRTPLITPEKILSKIKHSIDKDYDYNYKKKEKKTEEKGEMTEENEYYPGVNTRKMIIAALFAVLLLLSGIALNYTQFITSAGAAEPSYEDYTVFGNDNELFSRMTSLEECIPATQTEVQQYYTAGSVPEKPFLSNLCRNDEYLFYLSGNIVHALKYIGGKVSAESVIRADNPKGVFYAENMFGIVTEKLGEEEDIYYQRPLDIQTDSTENGDVQYETVRHTVKRSSVSVTLYDPSNSFQETFSYTQSGIFNDIFYENNTLKVITDFSTEDNADIYCKDTYLPYYITDEKIYLNFDSCYVPSDAVYSNYLTAGEISISGGAVTSFKAFGGGKSGFVSGDFAALNFDAASCVVNCRNNNVITLPGILKDKSSFDKQGNMIRAVISDSDGSIENNNPSSSLYIAEADENGITTVSVTENIGAGYELHGACFTEHAVYIAAERSGGIYLFGVDTSDIREPLEIPSATACVQSLPLIFTSSSTGFTAFPVAESSGERMGISVNVYDFSTTMKQTAQAFITAASSTADDWEYSESINSYLSSYSENDLYSLSFGENGSIAVPVRYFDGISEVEKVIVYNDSGYGELLPVCEFVQYDMRSEQLYTLIIDDVLFMLFDDFVITADIPEKTILQTLQLTTVDS